MPDPSHFPLLHCNDKKCFVCFVALSGDFRLDQIKIPENHFYWKILEPGKRVIAKELRPEIQSKLFIIRLELQTLPIELLTFPELFAALNSTLLKLLVDLTTQNNKSAAASLANRLIIDSFIYSACFHLEKENPSYSYEQIKMVYEWLEALSNRVGNAPPMSKSKFGGICKELYHRTSKRLEREILLQHSIEALINTPKTLDRLSFETGYSSREFFITAFKNHFGISPGKFRSNLSNLSSGFSS